MKKKIISLFLACIMMILTVPFSAMAQSKAIGCIVLSFQGYMDSIVIDENEDFESSRFGVSYSESKKTLYLKDALIKNISSDIENLTISVEGDCEIKSNGYEGAVLEGKNITVNQKDKDSSLTVSNDCTGIYDLCYGIMADKLYLNGLNLKCKAKAVDGGYDILAKEISIKDSSVSLLGNYANLAGANINSDFILIENSKVTYESRIEGTGLCESIKSGACAYFDIKNSAVSGGVLRLSNRFNSKAKDGILKGNIENSKIEIDYIGIENELSSFNIDALLNIKNSDVTSGSIISLGRLTKESKTNIHNSNISSNEITILSDDPEEEGMEIICTDCSVIKGEYLDGHDDHSSYATITGAHEDDMMVIIKADDEPEQTYKYSYSYDDSKTPYDNLKAWDKNDRITALKFTAYSKLAYSNQADFIGKSVDYFVGKEKHIEHKQKDDKIWDGHDVTFQKFYGDLIGDAKIVDTLTRNSSGFYGVCFYDEDIDKYIVAFRGSQNLSSNVFAGLMGIEVGSDWATDMAFAIRNELGWQFEDALDFYYDIEEEYGAENIIVTGHSLGGALGGYVSLVTGAPSIVIDGAVGHIIDASFWDRFESITGFEGIGNVSNILNITDTMHKDLDLDIENIEDVISALGDLSGADLIQTVHYGVYPMITIDPLSFGQEAEKFSSNKEINSRFCTHQQMSFIDYNENDDVFFVDDELSGKFCRTSKWSNDIFSGIIRKGRVQLGTSGDDSIKAPNAVIIDSIKNVQFGGGGNDRLKGHSDGDILAGGTGKDFLDGKGGFDVYYIDRNPGGYSKVTDCTGRDCIYLRDWEWGSEISVTFEYSANGEYILIYTDDYNNGVLWVNKNRSRNDGISLLAYDSKTDSAEFITDDILASASSMRRIKALNNDDANSAKLIVIDGKVNLKVYDREGNLLSYNMIDEISQENISVSSFSNEQENEVYTDFAYFYGYADEENDENFAEIYLFNEGHCLEIEGDGNLQIGLYKYDKENEKITSGIYSDEFSADGESITVISDGEESGIYVDDMKLDTEEVIYSENIYISDETVKLKKGQSKKLYVYSDTEDTEIEGNWFSEDEDIVSVDENGVITAKNFGECKVYFLSYDENLYAECYVTVKNNVFIGGDSVSSSQKPALPDIKEDTYDEPDLSKDEDIEIPGDVLNPFIDISENDWFYDSVIYCYKNGLMSGISEKLFGPYNNTSRDMIVTVLWRAEGAPAVKTKNSFKDISDDLYCTDAINWAVDSGIAAGYDDGRFGFGDPITRQQFISMLYRYAVYKNIDVSVGENTNILSYEDAFDVSDYAVCAVQWACGKGIINGSDGYILPFDTASRAQAASVFSKFYSLIK